MWFKINESAPTLLDAEIVSAITEISEPVESDNDDEESSMTPAEATIPSARGAADALELALTWLETQQINSVKIMQVQSEPLISLLQEELNSQSSKKQSRD